MTPWDGKERRGSNSEDHDLLTKIDANLTNFMEEYKRHVDKDETEFKEVDSRLKLLERGYWIAVGIIVFVEFVSKLIHI